MWPFSSNPKTAEEALRKAQATKDVAEREKWARDAIAKGDRSGEAHAIAAGAIIDQQDQARVGEAFELFQEAADLGSPFGMFNLHVMRAQGTGCVKDLGESRRWCLAAAEKGYARACYNAGAGHAAGTLGFEKDSSQAVIWYGRAMELGHARAAFNLGVMLGLGDGVPVDRDRAAAILLQSAKLGYPAAEALFAAGSAFLEAETDPKSQKTQDAIWLLAAAAALGHPVKNAIKE